MSFEIYFGISIILIVAIWASIYIFRRTKENNNEHLFDFIPHLFPTLGILFTFLGIAIGLWNFDSNDIEKSIPELMNGLKTAFLVSIFGVSLLVVFSFWTNIKKKELEKDVISQETRAIQELTSVLKELRTDMNSLDNNYNKVSIGENIKTLLLTIKQIKSSLNVQDDNGNEILLGNVLRDIYSENLKQSNSLQSFSSDLAITIEAGFQKILNDPSEGVVAELKLVKTEIENLGNKLKDPATDMTQSIVKELQESMGKMIEEFKTSMSGDTKNEMERLAGLLGQAGSSLTDFPAKLQHMTENLNENFKGLQDVVKQISQQTLNQSEEATMLMKRQIEEMSENFRANTVNFQTIQQNLINDQSERALNESKLAVSFMKTQVEEMTNKLSENFSGLQDVVKQISQQTLSQSEDSTNAMKKQIEEMSEILSGKVGDLQSGQENLLSIQSKNINTTEELVNSFNLTVKELINTSQEISESTQDFKDIQEVTKEIYSNLKTISKNISDSSSNFGTTQMSFSKYSNEFLRNNSSTIDEIQKSLVKAKDVSADYAQKFEIIEKGLQDIFAKITVGLKDYQETVSEGLETYLGRYSNALTETAGSLEKASAKQEDILEQLTEQLDKLNSRRN